MADARIGSVPFFDRGIERVVDAPVPVEVPWLPDEPGLVPSAQGQPNAVDELFAHENLESLLDRWVRPQIQPELLTPTRFRVAIAAAAAEFAHAAEIRRFANPRVGKLLDRAGRLLQEEKDLRELLQMFRSALLQA